MRNSIVGILLSVIVLFIGVILLPSYYQGVIEWRADANICQSSARNFVDMVIDNAGISDRAISDLNLSLAGCSGTFTYEIYREEKVTNPGTVAGTAEVTWIYTEITEDTVWHTGDIVTIVITQQGQNIFQKFSSAFLGQSYNNIEVRLAGMIR